MKSKPQFALSSSYESVQCLLKVLGKASMSVLLSSLVKDHTLEQSTPHSNPLLNRRSGVLFFFLILTVLQIHSLVFHVHSSRPSSSGSGKRTLHRKKKRKNPGALQRVSLEDLAEHRSAQACEENNHSWSRKTSRRMRENSA